MLYEFRLLRTKSRRAGFGRRQLVALPSLRYRIEMAEKDLGTLSQTLLRKLLEKFSKDFQNFNQGDFYPFLFVVRILV